MQEIGERINKRRESLGLQVKELSKKIGVTPSLISQIERAKAYPSLLTLKKIADALNTSIGELIGEGETLIQQPLIKCNDRKFAKKNKEGTKSFLLSNHLPQKQIEPYIINFVKNSTSTGIMTSKYPGQEFCYVVSGKFEVLLDDQKFILETGDSFYFNSKHNHLFKNINDKEAQLLWVITPNNL